MSQSQITKKHKAVIVLTHLLKGGRNFKVALKGETDQRTFVLSDDYELCQIARSDKGKEVLLRTGIELGHFVKLCERLTDEELFAVGCGTAFIEMADEADEKREAWHRQQEAEKKAAEEADREVD